MVRNLQLAETLMMIRDMGPDVIYNGSLSHKLVQDIRQAGGIITDDDLADYKLVEHTFTLVNFYRGLQHDV